VSKLTHIRLSSDVEMPLPIATALTGSPALRMNVPGRQTPMITAKATDRLAQFGRPSKRREPHVKTARQLRQVIAQPNSRPSLPIRRG
jgi:hypothetical protein